MRESLDLKTILLFFLPLIFMTELIQISHSVTNAFLARLSAPKETLAAFSIAFAFNILTGGITMACTQTGISFITDRPSFDRLLRFLLGIVCVPFLIVEITAVTPLGDMVFGKWMNASPEVVRQARWSSAIMGFWTFPILMRNLSYAMIMIRRRTILISYATFIRLAALVGFLILYSTWFEGAVVGAMATVSAMSVEAVFMIIAARPYFLQLRQDIDSRASKGEIWAFSWPLMLTQATENGVVFVLNFFLGQLASPDLALASFGVVYGMVRLILAPMRNLVQTAQTLACQREDLNILLKFTAGLLLFYVSLIFLLFYTSLREWILNEVMGLTGELSRYSTPGVKLTYLIAVFWGMAAFLRGALSAMRKTGAIAATAGIRLLVVSGIGCISLVSSNFNGTVLGVLAIGCAFAAEAVVLGQRLWVHTRSTDSLFPVFHERD
jgi:progressive ankylosis protein